jgi:pimeloyl-ACP methyl ester carboxylesterase
MGIPGSDDLAKGTVLAETIGAAWAIKYPDSVRRCALVHPAEAGVKDNQARDGNLKPDVLKLPLSRFKVNTQEQSRFRTPSVRSASRYASLRALLQRYAQIEP